LETPSQVTFRPWRCRLRWARRLKKVRKLDLGNCGYYAGSLIANGVDVTSRITLCYCSQAFLFATLYHASIQNSQHSASNQTQQSFICIELRKLGSWMHALLLCSVTCSISYSVITAFCTQLNFSPPTSPAAHSDEAFAAFRRREDLRLRVGETKKIWSGVVGGQKFGWSERSGSQLCKGLETAGFLLIIKVHQLPFSVHDFCKRPNGSKLPILPNPYFYKQVENNMWIV